MLHLKILLRWYAFTRKFSKLIHQRKKLINPSKLMWFDFLAMRSKRKLILFLRIIKMLLNNITKCRKVHCFKVYVKISSVIQYVYYFMSKYDWMYLFMMWYTYCNTASKFLWLKNPSAMIFRIWKILLTVQNLSTF